MSDHQPDLIRRRMLLERYPFLDQVVVGQDDESLSGPMISRGPAAAVLAQVADLGRSGNYPDEIPLQVVGAALFRVCMNAPDAEYDGLAKIVEGWQVAKTFKGEL